MADSLLTMTLGVGASLVKVLLQANGYVTEANFAGVAKEGFGILSWWENRGGDADEQLAKQIAEILAKKTRDMYEVYRDQGIDEERLGGVITEVEILFNKVVENDELLLLAVNDPDSFSEVLQDDIRQRRKNIESRLEPYFDKLVKAAVDEYVKLAPWSPKFQIEALKDLINKVDEILKNTAKGLENDKITHEKLDNFKEDMDALPKRVAAEIASKVSVQKPVIFGMRPDVAAFYIERGERARLCDLVIEGQQPRIVLVGMRGCGKSQLASDLAQWCEKQEWSLVAWINAVSREAVKNDLVELARLLPIDLSDEPNRDQIVNRCIDYFNSSNSGDRLIVFDNVKDIDDLIKLVPRGDGLRVVVTTTNDCGWKNQSWESIKVGVFSREDSIKCLLRITDSKDLEAAGAVAQKLGDLPLAIAQAGATACAEDWTLKKYLVRLKRYSISIVIKPVQGDSYTEEVYKALLMAVDAALDKLGGDEREVARRQLDGLAVLAQSGVPTRWIDPLSTDAYSSDLEENVPDIADENAHNALTALVKMSVVQQSADKTITMLHRLQAQVLRENWCEEKTAAHEEAFDAAVEILGRIEYEQLPSNATDARRCEVRDLITQLSAIAIQDYSRPLFERKQIRSYLYRGFCYAYEIGILGEAVELDATVGIVEEVLGAEHPDTFIAHNNLALAYDSAGRFGEAVELFERVLGEREEALGVEHPDTLSSRSGLACAYQAAGRFGEAIDLFERVLGEREEVLGVEHPATLTSRDNLACAYQAAGRFGEAIDLFERVLGEREEALGVEHPVTLSSRSGLAGAYVSVGRFGEAIDLFERVLGEREEVLGAKHSDTLSSRSGLACAYQAAGRFGEAIDLFERVLGEREEVLGVEHPATLTSRNNLACAYDSAGRFGEAIDLFERVLGEREEVLGAKHPDTLSSRSGLAGAYDSAGRFGEAIDLFERVLGEREEVLGVEHPATLTSRNNLACAYDSAGRFGEAIDLFERVLGEREEVLGAKHPDTLSSRSGLAYAYNSAGRFGEAIDLFERVLGEREEVLGAKHSDTLSSRNGLALAYVSVGRFGEAVELFERVLGEREEVLGAKHSDTLSSRIGLAYAYLQTEQDDEAIDLFERVLGECEEVLGAKHPVTLSSRIGLAYAYLQTEQDDEAIDLFERVLGECEEVLGAKHPVTLSSRSGLAGVYLCADSFVKAVGLFERVLGEREEVLGAEHPGTLAARSGLAYSYLYADQVAEAIDVCEGTLPDCRRVLGPEHPFTKQVKNILEMAKRKMNQSTASSE